MLIIFISIFHTLDLKYQRSFFNKKFAILGYAQNQNDTDDTEEERRQGVLSKCDDSASLCQRDTYITRVNPCCTLLSAFPSHFGPLFDEDASFEVVGELSFLDEEEDEESKYGCRGDVPDTIRSDVYKDKIVVIQRGQCTFEEKVRVAQEEEAVGVVVFDPDDADGAIRMDAKGDTTDIHVRSVYTFNRVIDSLRNITRNHTENMNETMEASYEALEFSFIYVSNNVEGFTFPWQFTAIVGGILLVCVALSGYLILSWALSFYIKGAKLFLQEELILVFPTRAYRGEAVDAPVTVQTGVSLEMQELRNAEKNETKKQSSPQPDIEDEPSVNQINLDCSQRNNSTTGESRHQNIEFYPAESCSICLEQFTRGEKFVILPCKHIFHRSCARQWVRTSPSCPICMQSVLPTQLPSHLGTTQNGSSNMIANRSYPSEDDLQLYSSTREDPNNRSENVDSHTTENNRFSRNSNEGIVKRVWKSFLSCLDNIYSSCARRCNERLNHSKTLYQDILMLFEYKVPFRYLRTQKGAFRTCALLMGFAYYILANYLWITIIISVSRQSTTRSGIFL